MIRSTELSGVSVAEGHACALDSSGLAYCWGQGGFGQQGDGMRAHNSVSPKPVTMPTDRTFSSLSTGWFHTCAIADDGVAYCWGAGSEGSLGNGDEEIRATSSAVTMPDGVRFETVSAGVHSTCALDELGRAYCWGAGSTGQIGDGENVTRRVPVAVTMPVATNFTRISVGGGHACALDANERAYCWGEMGLNGDDTLIERVTPTAVQMPPGATFAQISAGYRHSCATDHDGLIYCWGQGQSGALGTGDFGDRRKPTLIEAPEGTSFSAVHVGARYACALSTTGKAYCWGLGYGGQLGNNKSGDSDADQLTPVAVLWP